MKLKKCILSTFVLLGAMTMLTGCGGEEATTDKVAVCKSKESYDVRYRYEFKLNEDEKHIDEIKFIQTVNEENIKKVYPDKDLEETYKAFKDDMMWQYQTYVEGNENLAWFKGKIETNDEEHFAQLTFAFDTSNENLDVNDDDTVNFLAQFGVNMFYNQDEKAFLYDEDEFIKKAPLNGIYKVGCEVKEVEKTEEK